MPINFSDVVTEWGAYYIDGGQGVRNIYDEIYHMGTHNKHFTPITTRNTVFRVVRSTFQRVLQSFQKTYTPIGGVEFKPREIPLFKMKVDNDLEMDGDAVADDLEDSWLGFLAGDTIEREKWPFVRWYLSGLVKRASADFQENEVFGGQYVAPTPGTAGNAGETMDGIRIQLNNEINVSGDITPIATGALSTDPLTFYDQINAFVKGANGIPTKIWNRQDLMPIKMGELKAERYREGKKLKYAAYNSVATDLNRVDGTNFYVEGDFTMEGSEKIYTSLKWNFLDIRKRPKTNEKKRLAMPIRMKEDKRKIEIWGDWYRGVGFGDPRYVYTNDQDLL